MLFCAGATRAQGADATNAGSPLYKEVVDDNGRTVKVPHSVRRIISLAPSVTETIYALGLQDRLVADTDYCDYPPDAAKKPKVGGTQNPSLEQIAALHPDLVLVTESINRLDTVHSLDNLGISSYSTSEPHTVEEIISSLKKLASVLDAPEAGTSVADDMHHRLDELRQKLAASQPARVLFVVWPQPLISIGKTTFIADALRNAGAVSIIEAQQGWPQISLEEVARLQPDYLIFAPSHSDSSSRDFEMLTNLPGWRILNAVRNRRYVMISDAIDRPGPRIVGVIEELAHKLHPEIFQEKPEPEKQKPEKQNNDKEAPVAPPPSPQSHQFMNFESTAYGASL